MNREIIEGAAALGWFHSVPLGNGAWTKGHKTREQLQKEANDWRFPQDLSGKTVLDIGCADGYWSNLAVERGAKSVLAIDEQITGGLCFMLEQKLYAFKFKNMSIFSPEFLTLPQFDFVLFAGVIYHARHPLLSLERLRAVTGDSAIVESLLDNRFGESVSAMVYYGDSPGRFATWGPNQSCMNDMLRAAGFREVEMTNFYNGPAPYDRGS